MSVISLFRVAKTTLVQAVIRLIGVTAALSEKTESAFGWPPAHPDLVMRLLR